MKLFTVIIGALIFGWLGSFFGSTGTVIGVIIGIIAGLNSDDDKSKAEIKALPNTNGSSIIKSVSDSTILSPPDNVSKINLNEQNLYKEVVVEVIAACIAADGNIEESEIDMATLLIENDDLIFDKKGALESLRVNIDNFLQDCKKSKAIFKLKTTTIIHKADGIIDSLQRDRIDIVLDSMLDVVSAENRPDTVELIERIKSKLQNSSQKSSQQEAAERFILNSGNTEAIKSLREMQKNPSTYKDRLIQAAQGNTVMKTALGVFTGVIAANLITSAMQHTQPEQALANSNSDIDTADNLETHPTANEEVLVEDNEVASIDEVSDDTVDIDTDFDLTELV